MAADAGPGQRLVAGRYRLDGVLGRGGMGVVWLATDELLEREVALKEVTFSMAVGEEERRLLRERTMREARAAARLHHPCVTAVFDIVEEDGKPWLVMERVVAARSLDGVLQESGPLPPEQVARIGLDVLAALEAAHAAGVVHRDVKPANVLVQPDGHARLTDFGIATTTGDVSITGGALIGSPGYMAPERVSGEEAEPPVDLWSLGATLYTAVEGRRAFDRGDSMATLMAVVSEEPAEMVRAGPLEPVLRGLLVKDPAQRSGVAEARRGLQAVLDGPEPTPPARPAAAEGPSAVPAPPPSPPADESRESARRRPPAAVRGDAVARFSAEDLRALAAASRAVLGSVVSDARDHLAERQRDRRELRGGRKAAPAPSAPPPRRRRFKRRWVLVPLGVALLLLVAVIAVVVVVLTHVVDSF
jgi:eukaryotic-like serine/threonine-protein kinase